MTTNHPLVRDLPAWCHVFQPMRERPWRYEYWLYYWERAFWRSMR